MKAKLEWDETKRQKTLDERGLDFADMTYFSWETAVIYKDTRNTYGETRYITVGYLMKTIVVCVWCSRNGHMRIISLRKANKRERKTYEQAKKDIFG